MTSEYSIPVREIPIATLGQAKIPSPLPYGNMINTGKVMLSLSHEYDEDIDTHQTLLFEEAGPRQDLYFDPGKTKCAIVTCGGLCPGLNDVIRAIVLEAYHAYNTPSVLGNRYGLEGFIPSYSHNVMELTPARSSIFTSSAERSSAPPEGRRNLPKSSMRSNGST